MMNGNNTTFQVKGLNIKVTLHQTDIVKATADKITLDTGGFFSATTKRRMNQAADQFGLGYQVEQKKGEWYVTTPGGGRTIFSGERCRFTR